MIKKIILLGLALALGTPSLPAPFPETEIVSLPLTTDVLRAASRFGLDLLAEMDGRVFIAASPSDLQKIETLGFPLRFETVNFAPSKATGAPTADGPIGAYHTGGELASDLDALQAQYPQLAKVVEIGRSLENRPILALKVSANPELDEGEPSVLFLGCHHAREWISVEVPFLFGKYLCDNYASDPDVRRLVDATEIWIVPMVNPDGHDYTVRVYRYWRKNRRANDDGTFGVDLNRNYGFGWGYDDVGSSGQPVSEVYRGKSAFSEPETQAIRDFVLSRNFGSMISYHSYSQSLMYPWSYTTLPTGRDALLRGLGTALSSLMEVENGRVYLTGQSGAVLYVTNGDTTDWTYAATGMPSFTIELPPVDFLGGGFFNSEADIAPIFRENLPAMLALVDWTIAHPNPVPESSRDFNRTRRREIRGPRLGLKRP